MDGRAWRCRNCGQQVAAGGSATTGTLPYLAVGAVARVLGLTGEAVRKMSDRGELAALRTLDGWRLFDPAEVERVRQLCARRPNKYAPLRAK